MVPGSSLLTSYLMKHNCIQISNISNRFYLGKCNYVNTCDLIQLCFCLSVLGPSDSICSISPQLSTNINAQNLPVSSMDELSPPKADSVSILRRSECSEGSGSNIRGGETPCRGIINSKQSNCLKCSSVGSSVGRKGFLHVQRGSVEIWRIKSIISHPKVPTFPNTYPNSR